MMKLESDTQRSLREEDLIERRIAEVETKMGTWDGKRNELEIDRRILEDELARLETMETPEIERRNAEASLYYNELDLKQNELDKRILEQKKRLEEVKHEILLLERQKIETEKKKLIHEIKLLQVKLEPSATNPL